MHACVARSVMPPCQVTARVNGVPRSHAQGLRGRFIGANHRCSSRALTQAMEGIPSTTFQRFIEPVGPAWGVTRIRWDNCYVSTHPGICGWMIRWSSGRVTLVRQGASRQRAVQLGMGFCGAMRETRRGPRTWEPPSHERRRLRSLVSLVSLVRATAAGPALEAPGGHDPANGRESQKSFSSRR